MKIKELELNQIYTVPLAVKAVNVRETKAKKSYLAMEFFDGTDTIMGNYWDWNGVNIPSVNAVLDVRAQVTEWQGTKQLNIKGMTTNTEIPLSSFMPSSGVDISDVYKKAYSLVSDVADDFLRNLAQSILEELQPLWITMPGARSIHHAYTAGTLVHSYSVACIAKRIAQCVPGADQSLCIVGGMLHDLGKLFTYHTNGLTIEMTSGGMLYDHTVIGAEVVGNFAEEKIVSSPDKYPLYERKLEMLRHIILSHHGLLEHGAVVTPASLEAHIVHHADSIDATAEQIRVQSAKAGNEMWTERIWTLGNKPCISTEYIKELMKQPCKAKSNQQPWDLQGWVTDIPRYLLAP